MAGADANGFIAVDLGSGAGGHLDTTEVTYLTEPLIRDRDRIVIGGDLAAELADVLNDAPTSTTYGLITRTIPDQGFPNATVTSVSASATTVTLLAANSNRREFYVYNDSNSQMYLKFGSGASTTSFTNKIVTGGFQVFGYPNYTGIVTALWDTATGSARMTEVTV